MDGVLSNASQKLKETDRGKMTFEEWWPKALAENLPYPVSPSTECEAKKIARSAWNAALDAASGMRNPEYVRAEVAEMLEEFRA